MEEAVRQAELACRRLERVFPLLADLCLQTCRFCPEPCCVHARVWYDFRDLLFLALLNRPLPSEQPRVSATASCRYLGSRGCRLDRMHRPWICTWYLCPPQALRLRNTVPDAWGPAQRAFSEIKTARLRMEASFLLAVSRTGKAGSV